jgi:NCAIR mutase (PurE)-related protein
VIAEEINLDLLRGARIGLDEAIYAAGKSPEQIAAILDRIEASCGRALLTRLDADKFARLPALRRGQLDYCPVSRTAVFGACPSRMDADGESEAAVLAAGTSDVPVAREAERTLRYHGRSVCVYFDIGVAGLARLLTRLDAIRRHRVLIVAAGMEGALPSVVGGLVTAPVIAVPTSVGYGVAAGGRVALDAMLTSCSPGITVVNIDNGYGAACAALRLLNVLRPAMMPASAASTAGYAAADAAVQVTASCTTAP